MDVAVTGSSGLIGRALVRDLRLDGHTVRRVLRSAPPPGEPALRWNPARGDLDRQGLEGVDAVVHLAGIGDKRWSDARKREILESRTIGTRLLAETLAGLDRRPAVLVSGSAIDYYGDTADALVTEASPSGDGFLADICRQWEAATAAAADAGIRVVAIRTSPVQSAEGGSLARMLPFFRLGLGGRLGTGRQWWSWITIEDEVRAIRFLLDHDLTGPVNLAAPNPVTNAEYTKILGRVLRRPTVLPTPTLAPRLLVGAELTKALVLASHRVIPAALERAGFEFRHPQLDDGLRAVLAEA